MHAFMQAFMLELKKAKNLGVDVDVHA